MRVIVIGAGIGGLTLAHALRQTGIDVVVYERDGVRGRPQGVSLHIDDGGASALRACLPAGHVAMVEATLGGQREKKLVLSDVDGSLAVTGELSFDSGPVRARIGRQASRRLLRAIMLTGLRDTVRFGMEFTRFEQRADGTVRAWFAEGSSDTAHVLVGADGVGSQVRRQYLPHVQVLDTGKRMVFGETPLRTVASTGLGDLIGENPAEVHVRRTRMILAALRFTQPPPAARNQWLPTMDSRHVAGIEDFVMWALPTTPEQLGPVGSSAATWRWAQDAIMDLHPVVRLVVAQTLPDTVVALRIGMSQPVTPWPASPVTLLGDAIHASPGLGANLAMRDAQLLRDALVRVDRGEHDLLAAIDDYERVMRHDSFPAPTRPRNDPGVAV
jgi:2-polyprenyl-6-methoxyphenol hydroxylase-like FAD-dependent oxidoreductase